MRHIPKTLIVLANGSHARWVVRDATGLSSMEEFHAEPSGTMPPRGMVYESGSPIRHTAGEIDLQGKTRDRFAGELADRLNTQIDDEGYERLAIVAPPKMLLAIRNALSPAARSRIVLELTKDLVRTPLHELDDWLSPLTLPARRGDVAQPHR